ncbi:ABC transporter permease [Rhodococcus sp. ARC_M6]|uniref:ABC transporter permease n=1 Tax=Rhodococcus sp. ARC_M6 TaxID=2928852 RepID=UPI001FB524A4|nr:ABC transporter permease [Rhodococcus sp. ARC_M6]MCJ0907224.1 ABC transporter permease [Rhodococcus sp. ARC_M6]
MTSLRWVKRMGSALVVLWLVHLVTFSLIRLVPGDAAELIAGDRATSEQVDAIRHSLGLDGSVVAQYFASLSQLLHGDLGISLFSGLPVAESIMIAAPATLSIAGLALLIATVVGVSAGVVAGLKRGSLVDRLVTTAATLGLAMPSFWVGLVLATFFGLTYKLLPATGYSPLSEGVGPWLQHIILPSLALGLAVAAEIARHTRGGVSDVMARPYIRTARARGASGTTLVRRHVLRNAAIPVVTVLGLQAGKLLSGTIVIESVFGIAGLGSLTVNAVLQRDYSVLQGFIILAATVVVSVNLLVDVVYGKINPKVRVA